MSPLHWIVLALSSVLSAGYCAVAACGGLTGCARDAASDVRRPGVTAPAGSEPGASTVPAARNPSPPHARILWRFDGGAPLAGAPVIDDAGRVLLATTEGYVHALGPTGGYLWSYTLLGGVKGAPAAGPAGRVFVATAAGRLYALKGRGHELWVFRSTAPVLTDIAVDRHGIAYFAGADRRLYAVADRAIAIWGLALDAFVTSGPIALPNDDVVVATERGDLRVIRHGHPLNVIPLPEPVTVPIAARRDGSMCALAGSTLVGIGPDYESRWTFASVQAFAVSDSGALAVEDGALVWLDADGAVLHRHAVGVALGSGLALDSTGRAYAVTRDGDLLVVDPKGGAGERRIALESHPAQYLVLDAPRARVIAASGDGWVFSVDTPWITPAPTGPQPPENTDESEISPGDFPSGGVRAKD